MWKIPDLDELFGDGDARETLKNDAALTAAIRAQIKAEIAMLTDHPADPAPVAAIIGFPQSIRFQRLSPLHTTRVMEEARSVTTEFIIVVATDHVHFDTSQPLNFHNWNLMSLTPFAVPPGPPPPPSALDIATAAGNALPAPLSAADIAVAVTGAVGAGVAGGGGAGGPAHTSPWTHNPVNSPLDIGCRCARRQIGGLTLSNSIAPCAGGTCCHEEMPNKIILADGTLHLMQDPNPKALMRDPVRCSDNARAGICSWCNSSFQQHPHNSGFCCHNSAMTMVANGDSLPVLMPLLVCP